MKVLGSRDVEALELSKRSVRSFLEHSMPTYAAALAYRALFALFPFFAFLVSLLGLLEITSFFEWRSTRRAPHYKSNTRGRGSG